MSLYADHIFLPYFGAGVKLSLKQCRVILARGERKKKEGLTPLLDCLLSQFYSLTEIS